MLNKVGEKVSGWLLVKAVRLSGALSEAVLQEARRQALLFRQEGYLDKAEHARAYAENLEQRLVQWRAFEQELQAHGPREFVNGARTLPANPLLTTPC